MTSKQLMLPANRAFNSDGAPEADAQAFLYLSGTSTPATFYSDVGLSISLGHYITANAAGRFFPMPYGDETIPYRLVIQDAAGATLDDIDPFYFGQSSVFGAPNAYNTPAMFGAKGDGIADDTAAFVGALAASSVLYVPAGTYIVSELSVPANKTILTDGFLTVIKRKTGIADGTPIISVNGSNVRIGDIAVQGLIASESGEQNHGILIQANTANGNLQNISIGNVKAIDVRGDAVYIGSANSKAISQVKVGQIYANNCWRNGLTVADSATGIFVESVYEIACGQHTVDIEPNALATGSGIVIGYVHGRHIQIAGSAAAVNGVEIYAADLDLTYGSNSTPANPVDHKVASQATGTDNGVVVLGAIAKIGSLSINGYTGQAIIAIAGSITARLEVDSLRITNCCSSDTVYNSYVQGGAEYIIGDLTATTTLSTHNVFSTCTNTHVDKANVALVTGSKYMASNTDCRTNELTATVSGAGNGGILFSNCVRNYVGGGTQTGDRFFSSCTNCRADNVNATMVTGYDVSPTASNLFYHSIKGGTYTYFADSKTNNNLDSSGNLNVTGAIKTTGATSGIGYQTGAGGVVTQATSRTTGVTLNKVCGQITLVSAAGTATWQTFTVTNSAVAATDVIRLSQAQGADKYMLHVTNVAAGSFDITYATTGGTTTEQPVINFAVIKAVNA